MARKKVPILRGKRLTWIDEYDHQEVTLCQDIVSDWRTWQSFLNAPDEKSFRFIAPDERSISVRKERRKSYGRDVVMLNVWYAYKTIGNRKRRKYIGVSGNVTYQKLLESVNEIYRILYPT